MNLKYEAALKYTYNFLNKYAVTDVWAKVEPASKYVRCLCSYSRQLPFSKLKGALGIYFSAVFSVVFVPVKVRFGTENRLTGLVKVFLCLD